MPSARAATGCVRSSSTRCCCCVVWGWVAKRRRSCLCSSPGLLPHQPHPTPHPSLPPSTSSRVWVCAADPALSPRLLVFWVWVAVQSPARPQQQDTALGQPPTPTPNAAPPSPPSTRTPACPRAQGAQGPCGCPGMGAQGPLLPMRPPLPPPHSILGAAAQGSDFDHPPHPLTHPPTHLPLPLPKQCVYKDADSLPASPARGRGCRLPNTYVIESLFSSSSTPSHPTPSTTHPTPPTPQQPSPDKRPRNHKCPAPRPCPRAVRT